MGELKTGRPRVSPLLRGLVAWCYLFTGLLTLPVASDLLLHELGVISGSLLPVPELGGWLIGLLIFLGWPFAIACAWIFRRDSVLALPAVLFLAAELMLVIHFQVAPNSKLLSLLSAIAGAVFGISAIRTWMFWVGDRSSD